MAERKELEHILQQEGRRKLLRGEIDRRQFLTNSLVAGLGMAGVSAANSAGTGCLWTIRDRPP